MSAIGAAIGVGMLGLAAFSPSKKETRHTANHLIEMARHLAEEGDLAWARDVADVARNVLEIGNEDTEPVDKLERWLDKISDEEFAR